MIYELASLDMRLWGAMKALDAIAARLAEPDVAGRLLGCWEVDVGVLSRLLILRSFESEAELESERRRLRLSADPFGAGEFLAGYKVESFIPFPFAKPVEPGEKGRLYEFREYQLVVGGVAPTLQAWEAALPERERSSPVLAVMYAADGPPRMLHIVAYESYDARAALRVDLYRRGVWPPKGAPEQIVQAASTLALPTRISPLR